MERARLERLPTCSEVVHLGHVLCADLDESSELERIGRAFNRQFHAFFGRFSILKGRDVLISLYKSFCSSFYGLESIALDSGSWSSVRFLKKSVNLALMKLLDLPRESVSPFLIARGVENVDTVWAHRGLTFWRRYFYAAAL